MTGWDGARTFRALLSLAATLAAAAGFLLLDPDVAYLWMKVVHIVAVTAWMAGMFYLPRLFVYHALATVGSETSETFKVMEHRLLRVIMNPAMVLSWMSGLWLAWRIYAFEGDWLWSKIALVVVLTALHGYLAVAVGAFAEDRNTRRHVWWRVTNEVPTVLLIAIVIFVILKPF